MAKKKTPAKKPPKSKARQRVCRKPGTLSERKLRALARAYEKEQRELRRPGKTAPDIATGDPVAWLMQIIYVEAVAIPPDKVIPPSEDKSDAGDGVPAGELHLLLRQIRTRRDEYLAAELDHERQALLERDPEKRAWHEEQEERCDMVARALTAILGVSICDAHSLYGKDVGYHITPAWLVRRTTNL